MTRVEKIATARRMKAESPKLPNRVIGEQLGVATSTVWAWLNPERKRELGRRDNAKPERKRAKRANENAHRAPCPDCGEPMGPGSGYGGSSNAHKYNRCAECHRIAERTRVDERARQIEKWWAHGESRKQISARLGWSQDHLSREMDQLRAKGYDLPYRRKPGKRNATAYPEQVPEERAA